MINKLRARETKNDSDKQKQREFVTNRHILQELIKGYLQRSKIIQFRNLDLDNEERKNHWTKHN